MYTGGVYISFMQITPQGNAVKISYTALQFIEHILTQHCFPNIPKHHNAFFKQNSTFHGIPIYK